MGIELKEEMVRMKESLVEHCLDTWMSKAKPITLMESVCLSSSLNHGQNGRGPLEDGQAKGAVIPSDSPGGCFWVPFDASPPNDRVLLEKRREIRRLKEEMEWDGRLSLVIWVMDQEIKQRGLLEFEPPGTGSLDELSAEKKVEIIAKSRLQDRGRFIDVQGEALRKHKGTIKIGTLRLTGDYALEGKYQDAPIGTMSVQNLSAYLDSLVYPPVFGVSSLEVYEATGLTDSSPAMEEFREFLKNEPSEEEKSTWSYMLVTPSASEHQLEGLSELAQGEWKPLGSPRDMDRLMGSIQNNNTIPVFTKTWRIKEMKRWASLSDKQHGMRSPQAGTNGFRVTLRLGEV